MEKLFRVGEIIEYTELSRQTIHLYTQMQLIKEKRRTLSGYRLYDEEVFAVIEFIKKNKKQGKTLLEIKNILDTKGYKSKKNAKK
jgi:DNA-binding transcriptional MerR regulator